MHAHPDTTPTALSRTLLARAKRGYARFLTSTEEQDAHTDSAAAPAASSPPARTHQDTPL